MKKILIIDDEEILRNIFSEFLTEIGYETLTAQDGLSGLEVFNKDKFDLIITDLTMPRMNGLDIIKAIREIDTDIPIIVVSGVHDIKEMMTAIHLGAWDYLVKPIMDLQVIEHSVSRCLERAKLIEENRKYSQNVESAVREKTEEFQKELQMRTAAESLLRQSFENLTKVTDQIIRTISLIGDIRDPYTGGHQHRVAQLSRAIAQKMGLDAQTVKGVFIGAQLHDIGKISIPLEILSKPGRLNDVEMAMIRIHSTVGHDILKGIEFQWPIHQMVLQHHERIDGSGYPEGIGGDEILLEARIISIADVVEAISSHRPYRPALGIEVAVKEIKANIGRYYDKNAAECCLALIKEGFTFESV